jgi:hypothetical protein
MENEVIENGKSVTTKNKGGRPKKVIKQDCFIGVKCSSIEKETLKQKAETAGLSLSEFLRETALGGQLVRQIKTIPQEVLQLTGLINHIAANINQIAKKCNRNDELNAGERKELQTLPDLLKHLAFSIKNYLK